ncbi:MAG: dynamin family protein [Pseudonocardiales bacterium]
MTEPTSAVPEVVNRVLRLANEVHEHAQTCGRDDLGALLADQASRWTESTATIVLAGAQKRGKSRLLNVLLGRPGLLPVDADIATHTHVAIRYGEHVSVTVHRSGPGGPSESVVAPADLIHYASVLGDPVKRQHVTGLDVTVDQPLLEGVCLVDTPGVDSLTLGHRHATMAALNRADALLFAVSSQDQPILRHELEFLAEAASRIHAVAFVFTKVEDSTSWQELLTENRDRLARFVEQSGSNGEEGMHPAVARRLLGAPWIPVSAKLGEAALSLREVGQHDRAESRRQRSGLDALERYIRRCAGRRELVRAGGVLALTVSALRGLDTVGRDQAIGSGADDGAVAARQAELDAALAELAELRRARRLRGVDQQFLGRESTHRARARLETYRRTYEREIAELDSAKVIATYVADLGDSIDRSLAAAWSEIVVETEQLATEAITGYLAELGLQPTELDIEALAISTRTRASISADGTGPRFDALTDGLPAVMMAGSAGYLTMTLATALGATLTPLAPLALGAAIGASVLVHKRRLTALARDRAALVVALGDLFAVAANDICLAVERAITTWRTSAEQTVEEAFTARQRELELRRRELATLATQDAAAKARSATEAAERLRTVTAYTERATQLSTDLDAALRVQG